jgi:hypothetical protein
MVTFPLVFVRKQVTSTLNYQVVGPSRIESQLWQLQQQINNLSGGQSSAASASQAGPSRAEAETMYKALVARVVALEATVVEMKAVAKAIHPFTQQNATSTGIPSTSSSSDETYAKFHKVASSTLLTCRPSMLEVFIPWHRCFPWEFLKKQCCNVFAARVLQLRLFVHKLDVDFRESVL